MCDRYTHTHAKEIYNLLGHTFVIDTKPRYNVAPTQTMPVIVAHKEKPEARMMRWGLIPSRAAEPKTSFSTTNARAEDLEEKPTWRRLIYKHRCLVPADGWYEWTGPETARLPWRFTRPDHKTFCFAGLWDRWQKGDAPAVESFSIIVTRASEDTVHIHDRMPVIVMRGGYETWLASEWDLAEDYLLPYQGKLEIDRVNPIVNSARNETPQCIEPVGE